MIEINLLPEELKKKMGRFSNIDFSKVMPQNFPLKKIAIIVILAFVISQIILFLIGAGAASEIKGLSKKHEAMLPGKKEADLLKMQVDILNKKVKAIDGLMIKRFSWAKKLSAISDSMTQGIWLSDLSYDEYIEERIASAGESEGMKPRKAQAKPVVEKTLARYLVITGYASRMGGEGTALVGKFIQGLKDNKDFYKDFSDITLGSIKSDKVADQEVMSFKITCSFKT